MKLLHLLGITGPNTTIDWDITPAATYGLFECRGDTVRVRSKNERYYYFWSTAIDDCC